MDDKKKANDYAIALANAHAEGLGERCRRYRRRATVRRVLCVAILLAVSCIVVDGFATSAASRSSSKGVLVASEAVETVHQILVET